jgi:hypothetical protein
VRVYAEVVKARIVFGSQQANNWGLPTHHSDCDVVMLQQNRNRDRNIRNRDRLEPLDGGNSRGKALHITRGKF